MVLLSAPVGARLLIPIVRAEGETVLPLPDEADSLAFEGEGLRRGGRQVLLGDDELRARVEGDDVAGIRAEIHDLPDSAGRDDLVGGGLVDDLPEADLLGPDGVRAGRAQDPSRDVAAQEVRGPDEAGDEPRRRPLVDLGRAADLLDPAIVEDGEAV